MNNQIKRIRDLARQTCEYAHSELMNQRRKLWREHNSLSFSRSPVCIRAIPFDEFLDAGDIQCTDPYLQILERQCWLGALSGVFAFRRFQVHLRVYCQSL